MKNILETLLIIIFAVPLLLYGFASSLLYILDLLVTLFSGVCFMWRIAVSNPNVSLTILLAALACVIYWSNRKASRAS